MRVMIDTNIIISAALFPNGRAAQAFYKTLIPPYQPIVCDYVVDELHRKFREKFPDKLTELEAFLYNALSIIELVPTPEAETAAENGYIDGIVAPDSVRETLVAALDIMAGKRVSKLPKKHNNIRF